MDTVDFPDILKHRINQLDVEMRNAVAETAKLLGLSEGDWTIDLRNARFVKVERKQPSPPKKRGKKGKDGSTAGKTGDN